MCLIAAVAAGALGLALAATASAARAPKTVRGSPALGSTKGVHRYTCDPHEALMHGRIQVA
jgi:plastocyanin